MVHTKTDKLFNILDTGKNVSVDVLKRRTGLVNVSSAIHRLRKQGYNIYLNRRNTKNGNQTFYRMATLNF